MKVMTRAGLWPKGHHHILPAHGAIPHGRRHFLTRTRRRQGPRMICGALVSPIIATLKVDEYSLPEGSKTQFTSPTSSCTGPP